MGKSRLAPIKAISIPRLELTAAVLAVRLDELIRKELELPQDSSFFWTDYSAVLFCMRNATSRYPVFVANRLAIIHEHTNVCKWRHIPSSLNPADSASRGLQVDSLDTKLRLKGPSFLKKPESDWPTSTTLTDEPPEEFLTSKRQPVHTTIVVETEETVVERLLSRCSSLSKLKRVTAWILKLISTLQHSTQRTIHPQVNSLSVEELRRQKWFQPSKNLELDDVVLLVDDLQQRSKWALGRVVKTLPDKRGLMRTVHVKTKNKVVTRPIAKLCLILDKTIR